jgi:hypothetical protein
VIFKDWTIKVGLRGKQRTGLWTKILDLRWFKETIQTRFMKKCEKRLRRIEIVRLPIFFFAPFPAEARVAY